MPSPISPTFMRCSSDQGYCTSAEKPHMGLLCRSDKNTNRKNTGVYVSTHEQQCTSTYPLEQYIHPIYADTICGKKYSLLHPIQTLLFSFLCTFNVSS